MDNVKIQSVKFNFIMNVILKLSSMIFPLITLPYVTRVLGATGNGKVAFATSVISYFSMFAQLGIPTYGIRVCAQMRDNPDELTKTVHELLILNSVSVILAYIVFVCCMIFVPEFRHERLLLIINSSTILLNMIGMEWFYQAIEQYRYITIRNLIFKCLTVILMFILIHNKEDFVLYGSLTVISAAGSNVFNLIHSSKYLLKKKYANYEIVKHIKPIFYFFAISVAVSVYTNMDTVMLGFLNADDQVGYYNIATKIKLMLITVITALGPVLLPRISNCLAKGMFDRFYELLKKSLHFVLLMVLPITAYFVIFAPDTISVLGGKGYTQAVEPMRIIMFTLIPMGVGNVACMQILAPMGLEKYTMYSTIVGAVINLIINAILIPNYGATGAAVATVIAEIVVASLQVYFSRKILVKVLKNISFLRIIIPNIAVLVALIFLAQLLCFPALINLIIAFVVMMVLYVALLISIKDSLVYEYLKKIIRKKNQEICKR